jgi:hypothetical protein
MERIKRLKEFENLDIKKNPNTPPNNETTNFRIGSIGNGNGPSSLELINLIGSDKRNAKMEPANIAPIPITKRWNVLAIIIMMVDLDVELP